MFDTEAFRRDLHTITIGHAFEYYPQVGSTNDIVRERARAGHPEGLVVVADEQIGGRGRLGRGWSAPAGSSLLLSTLLRPRWLAPEELFLITMLAGVALCEAVEETVVLSAALKWPNDLLLPVRTSGRPELRKAAGILSELDLPGTTAAAIVVGIGVNVNWTPRGSVDGRDLATTATSIGAAAGTIVDRIALLRHLLKRFDARYERLREGERTELFNAWRTRLAQLGQPVTVRLPTGELHGIAEDVEPTGALLVRDESGTLHIITAGDVGN